MPGKGLRGEHQSEPRLRILNVCCECLYDVVGASYERLLEQSTGRVVEYPHALVLVRSDDEQ